MSESINDGGAAFPQNTFEELRDGVATITDPKAPGMSLRDYFAAKAMQSFCGLCFSKESPMKITESAEEAYAWSDAMLAARKEKA